MASAAEGGSRLAESAHRINSRMLEKSFPSPPGKGEGFLHDHADVGILGIFSDWPATVTYYANCMGLR